MNFTEKLNTTHSVYTGSSDSFNSFTSNLKTLIITAQCQTVLPVHFVIYGTTQIVFIFLI